MPFLSGMVLTGCGLPLPRRLSSKLEIVHDRTRTRLISITDPYHGGNLPPSLQEISRRQTRSGVQALAIHIKMEVDLPTLLGDLWSASDREYTGVATGSHFNESTLRKCIKGQLAQMQQDSQQPVSRTTMWRRKRKALAAADSRASTAAASTASTAASTTAASTASTAASTTAASTASTAASTTAARSTAASTAPTAANTASTAASSTAA
eukprot:scpid102937/ scgid0389/ 